MRPARTFYHTNVLTDPPDLCDSCDHFLDAFATNTIYAAKLCVCMTRTLWLTCAWPGTLNHAARTAHKVVGRWWKQVFGNAHCCHHRCNSTVAPTGWPPAVRQAAVKTLWSAVVKMDLAGGALRGAALWVQSCLPVHSAGSPVLRIKWEVYSLHGRL